MGLADIRATRQRTLQAPFTAESRAEAEAGLARLSYRPRARRGLRSAKPARPSPSTQKISSKLSGGPQIPSPVVAAGTKALAASWVAETAPHRGRSKVRWHLQRQGSQGLQVS